MCKATLEFAQNNAKRALSNSVLSEAEVRCKKDLVKKWEFKTVKEFQINYKGRKGSQQGDLEDEDELTAKK